MLLSVYQPPSTTEVTSIGNQSPCGGTAGLDLLSYCDCKPPSTPEIISIDNQSPCGGTAGLVLLLLSLCQPTCLPVPQVISIDNQSPCNSDCWSSLIVTVSLPVPQRASAQNDTQCLCNSLFDPRPYVPISLLWVLLDLLHFIDEGVKQVIQPVIQLF